MAALNDLFTGNGELMTLMRSLDWSQTSIGVVEEWSPSLCTALSICFNSYFPTAIWWGTDLVLLYNEAWCHLLGAKHPTALGQPGQMLGAVVWDDIGAHITHVLTTGQAVYSANGTCLVDHARYPEGMYLTCSHSPIFGEGRAVQGVFTIATEIIHPVLEGWQSGRSDPSAQIPAPGFDRLSQSQETAHILVVDSNIVTRNYVQRLLQPYYQVETVSNSVEALASIDRQFPDLVLADATTSESAGFELLHHLRSDPTRQELPTILISTRTREESRLQALNAGADDYLVKPFSARELFTNISATLKMSQIRREASRRERVLQAANDAARDAVAQNEIRLQEHQHLLQQVTDTVPGILYVYDLIEQQNVYVNGQVTDMLGYTPIQVQAMGACLFFRLVHPDDLTQFPAHIAKFSSLRDGEVLENEYRMRNAQGEWRWFSGREIVFSRTPTGEPKQILGSAYDITDRKQAEEDLRREKERFELAAAAVDCLIYDWDLSTQTVERSGGLTRIFGFSPEEAEPTPNWWIDRIHPDDLEASYTQVTADLGTQNRYSIEYRVRNKHNQYVYVLDQGFIVRDHEGNPVRVVGTTTDISDRKITEKLQQFLLELNDSIRVATEPEEIAQIVVNQIGIHYEVSLCCYGEVDDSQEYATTICEFCQGDSSAIGRYHLNSFGPAIIQTLKRGITVVVDDIATDPRTTPYQHSFTAIGMRSLLCVPLVKQEQLMALLILSHSQPYTWNSEEITLMEESIDRIWLAIEKVRAEKALRQSEARFQRLATNVPGVIFRYLLHPDGNEEMLYISPSCRSLFELESETVQENVGTLWALVQSEDMHSLRDLITLSAQTQQPIHWEGQCTTPSNLVKWIQLVSRPEQQPDGSVLWDGLLTDISGTKEIELEREQLFIQSEHYATQLHGLTEAALAVNSTHSIEEVLQIITEQAHAIVGTHLAATSLVNNQNWETATHARYLSAKYAEWSTNGSHLDGAGIYAEVCRQNQPMRLSQAELSAHPHYLNLGTTPTDHSTLNGWLAAPLTDRHGHNMGLIQLSDKCEGEFTDSDEAILVQLAQMASVAIENTRLYEAEQKARTQAEATNRIKDEFLAVLSHELRSPLNPILGWIRLMRKRKLDERTVDQALETIERNAKLQTQLVEDLLDVSRILQGKMILNSHPVDLVATVEATMETIYLAAEAKGIEMNLQVQPQAASSRADVHPRPASPQITVLGDANRLQQVVWNLLSNAVKFTPQGGRVDIQLSTLRGQGTIDTGEAPQPTNQQTQLVDYAQIQVSDTGKGIEPSFLPYVFEYFRQEDSATTRRFGGLGLGLAIVRHIVELHGGYIQAFSQGADQGATFLVRLPLLKPNF